MPYYHFFILKIRFIKDIIIHRKRSKKVNQFYDFSQRILDWVEEIKDPEVKKEFMLECIDNLNEYKTEPLELIDTFNLEESEQRIFNKWGDHIPSLRREIRHKRLQKLI